MTQEMLFDIEAISPLTARQRNILHSPKQHGNADEDARPYLAELGIPLTNAPQPIQFQPNTAEPIHRWSPYVQGFSASFVQRTLDYYRGEYHSPTVFGPFSGSGTVLVQAKLNGYSIVGVELNPLLHFVALTKVSTWRTPPNRLLQVASEIYANGKSVNHPAFLKSESQFLPPVLHHLKRLKGGIDAIEVIDDETRAIKDLLLLAFASILVDNSNLKRSPCLGYYPKKVVDDDAPLRLFAQKVEQMAEDLRFCQARYRDYLDTAAQVILGNSMNAGLPDDYNLVITSPPYMNGLDHVMNYKIEMGWLGYGQSHRELKQIKDQMVVCDNVSKGLIQRFEHSERYTNSWIDSIRTAISENIRRRGNYRRHDMPAIVHKYFDDMYQVMKHVIWHLKPGGRFILVVGDSLIADVYVPTDLILARIGQELGLSLEKLEKARERRSGQVRSYRLRETIITLRK